jgi:hypothetical protein
MLLEPLKARLQLIIWLALRRWSLLGVAKGL